MRIKPSSGPADIKHTSYASHLISLLRPCRVMPTWDKEDLLLLVQNMEYRVHGNSKNLVRSNQSKEKAVSIMYFYAHPLNRTHKTKQQNLK